MQDTQELAYAGWRRAPEPFWAEAAEAVSWYRRWNQVLDGSRAPFYRWFSGVAVTFCYNGVDRHLAAVRSVQAALFHSCPFTNKIAFVTYRTLMEFARRF